MLTEEVAEQRRRVSTVSGCRPEPASSHRPPSREGYAKPAPRSRRERTDRQPGGQPGHPAAPLGRLRTSHEVIIETIGAVTTTMD